MDAKRAYEMFTEKYPNLTVTEMADYDRKFFAFVALEDPNVPDMDDPFYLLDKRSGAIRNFSPIEDPDRFNAAFYYRKIKMGKRGD